MKKTIFTILLALAPLSAFSASPKTLKAVLDSEYSKQLVIIDKLEVVATYRCPECYDIAITGSDMRGALQVVVRTEMSLRPNQQDVSVYFVGSSRR